MNEIAAIRGHSNNIYFNNKTFIVLSFNFIPLTGYAAMTEKRHGLATLTFTKLVVCSRKHKGWVLVVLVQ